MNVYIRKYCMEYHEITISEMANILKKVEEN